MNNLIVIKQLPIIEEQLQTIKEETTAKIEKVLALACTEDTVKEIKSLRAMLNKEFAMWEERRKDVKQAIMGPYTQFDASYKECITDVYKSGDLQLKGKIEAVESTVKAEKQKEVEDYFNEYLASKNVDFVAFADAGINITLSASMKSLKEQAKAFIDKVSDDLALIELQPHKDEVLYEYKRNLNVSASITMVIERHKAIEEEKAAAEARAASEAAEAEAVAKVEDVIEDLAPPTVVSEPVENEEIIAVAFTVRATRTKLRALKEFLNEGGYDYE